MSDGYDSFDDPPSQGRTARGPVTPPPNHMVKAILVTAFCCLPFGVVAIVNAAQVNGAAMNGNIELAQQYSEQADKWSNYAMLGWLLAILAYLVLVFGLGAMGAAANR